ncbi:uncharacterized protein A1O9_10693 [Exophiala aquamarina CBS 119918]|uniref:Uncharacterized protein n=1 Tax=Exophiala aquamarina CBS 119918 TaxID=1182545 RepID=A0A072PCG1_9EURO|nr:uncharacterized protein A1O9_10693 [Exophiala aquamarina CBS 119918]KEF53245.1 hypothetical protein A1O9_10693 [Exophiala aquamarina CBS 119918]
MSSQSGSSGIRRDCSSPPMIDPLQQLPFKQDRNPGSEILYSRPPSEEQSQPDLNETQQHIASKENFGQATSPLANIDTPSSNADVPWTPQNASVVEDGLTLAENGEPYVPIEDQEEGVNDVMSGAVGMLDTPLTGDACNENNFLLSPTMVEAQTVMPFKLLRARDLQKIFPIYLENDDSWYALPENFYIPVFGLVQAVVELQSLITAGSQHIPDEIVICALAKRGGTSNEEVVYPEQIEPLIDTSDPDFDWEFWAIMRAQGTRH